MNSTAPTPEQLLDYAGRPRPMLPTTLDFAQTRLCHGFHEAAHAVLGMAYGMHITSSEVLSWQDGQGNGIVTGVTYRQAYGTPPWHFAAMCAAGEGASIQHLLASGLWTPERAYACTAEHDREQAIDVLAEFGYRLGRDHIPEGGKSWGMVRGMARRKIAHLWWEIRTVAHALDEASALTGDEIAALTGMVNPAFVEATS